MDLPFLYRIPIWSNGLLFIVIMLISIELGYRIGRWRANKSNDSGEKENRTIILTSMYALLGLMLAFTYTFTLSRADMRKAALIDESNALSSAFLSAGMMEEPTRTELRTALLEYTKTRVVNTEASGNAQKIKKIIEETYNTQTKIWPIVQGFLDKSNAGPVKVSIIHAINNVFDIGAKRIAVSFDFLPMIILFMLLFLACSALILTGYNAGLGGHINRAGSAFFVLFLAVVIMIITDFDRSYNGYVQVNQQCLIDTISDMETILSK